MSKDTQKKDTQKPSNNDNRKPSGWKERVEAIHQNTKSVTPPSEMGWKQWLAYQADENSKALASSNTPWIWPN
ncbi:MAG: hypothetical protein K0R63_1018 [Rickettsiales bacterium]|jgi:hypothetical protein|nr:hypothetical protein [Rickettsiales bacterium]